MGCGCDGKTAQQRAAAIQALSDSANQKALRDQAAASGQVGGVVTTSAYLDELKKLKNK